MFVVAAIALPALAGCTTDGGSPSQSASPDSKTSADPRSGRLASAEQALGAADPHFRAMYPADLERMLDAVCTAHRQTPGGDPASMLIEKYPGKLTPEQAGILVSVALTAPGYCQ